MDRQQTIDRVVARIPAMTDAVRRAVRRAVWEHKRLGYPICISRDGRVAWIPPDQIDVEKPEDDSPETAT